MRTCIIAAIVMLSNFAAYAADVPSAVLRSAPPLKLPGINTPDKKMDAYVDCNSPAHWDGKTMYLFSSAGRPWRSPGPDLFHLDPNSVVTNYDNAKDYNGGRWIEATHKDASGKLYGWYHREPGGVCENTRLTAPQIGAVVSDDNGMNWRDLGIVLKAPEGSLVCQTVNKYFAGGNGDFSVILDGKGEYFYFMISTYNDDVKQQGFSVARMRYEDRDQPVGKANKWHEGAWNEPGLGGKITPIFPAAKSWHLPDADAFWGPSIHWNTHLNQYVVLLNRTKDKDWNQEGVYVTFNPNLANPSQWSKPSKILGPAELEQSKWYPQVVGIDASKRETDKLAGQVARLFVAGRSKWEIVFLKPGEKLPASQPAVTQ